MNRHFNLETIFNLLDKKFPKFKLKPPQGLDILKRFYESQYSDALRYINTLKQLKSVVKEVWLCKEGTETCLVITSKPVKAVEEIDAR